MKKSVYTFIALFREAKMQTLGHQVIKSQSFGKQLYMHQQNISSTNVIFDQITKEPLLGRVFVRIVNVVLLDSLCRISSDSPSVSG